MLIGSILVHCPARSTSFFTVFHRQSNFIFKKKWNDPVSIRQLSGITRLTTIKKTFPTVFDRRPVLFRNFSLTKYLRSGVNTNVAKDVMLYKFDNTRLFRIVTLFGLVNCLVFLSLAGNLYTITQLEWEKQSNNAPSEFDLETNKSPKTEVFNPREHTGLYSYLDVSSDTLRLVLAGVCFVLAYAVVGACYIYCNKSVRYVVLRKGGKQVTVVTHGFFAMNRYYTHDLEKMSCRGNRTISSALLLQVKGKFLSYILDKNGEYSNPPLFDSTVGLLRDIKK